MRSVLVEVDVRVRDRVENRVEDPAQGLVWLRVEDTVWVRAWGQGFQILDRVWNRVGDLVRDEVKDHA